ncbi:cytosolic sulfotransferase 15-like [Rhododendron vialii]|uniref:cytosolic sulfotransferase 15-like n=1 Tax=Rhododendron vialii TaxID=182163 RepID=UPI00265EFFAD|nr:cytosolic sulfotransferase 15-like [Rhododendron vialii]
MAASIPCSSLNKMINKEEERDHESIKKVERSYQRYREIISTLPKEKGWIAENMCLYEGFWYQPMHGLAGVMFAQEHFQARPDDVFLVSAPKSGSTWLKALIFAVMKRTCYASSAHPLLTTNPHDCVPFFEFELFKKPPVADVDGLPSPRIFATHIPYTSLPKSVLDSGCKIVYVCRDPKDVLISMWYFLANVRSKELPPLSLEEAVDLFSRGVFGFGPFWDHVQGYWKASLECPERIFFITYEQMKRDTFVKVKRLAEFLGQPFSMEEEGERVVEEIIELCSFGKLRNLEVNKNGSRNPDFKNDAFFRKGEVGDWKNHLTPQMVERLDQITNEKLPGIF